MNPLSITVSVIALLQLTQKVIDYARQTKDAPKERIRVLQEASSLPNYLIHDSASGPIDSSGPRCIFTFRSSAFYEPALARQRVLQCLLFRLDLEPLFVRTRTSTFIFKALNLGFGLKKHAKRTSRLGRKSRSSLSKALSKRSKTVLRHYKGTSMNRRSIRVIVY
jgi:hypothetical protein